MWFAFQDSEFEKKKLYQTPALYVNGPNNRLFNKAVFWRWMIYAIGQAALMVFLVTWTFSESVNTQGQSASFWVNGMMVYCCVVMLANMEVLFQSNNYNWVTFFLNFGSSATFFIVYAVESELSIIPTLWGTFFYFWVTPTFYLILIFLIITQIFF